MIQLPKISKELEEEYLADVQKSYKELLEKLKKSRNDVKKKKTKTEDDKQKQEEEYLSEVKAIVDFLSTEGKLDDDKIKNILVGRVAHLEKAMATIGPIKSNLNVSIQTFQIAILGTSGQKDLALLFVHIAIEAIFLL